MQISAEQFMATKFDRPEDKTKYCEALIRFIEKDFPREGFTNRLYEGLHVYLFGHIAHFNKHGFYAEWFSSTRNKVAWFENALQYCPLGDPAYTWSDVERVLRRYFKQQRYLETYQARLAKEIEAAERAMLARLKEKYGE